VVAGGDGDGIEVLVLEGAANVLDTRRALLAALLDRVGAALEEAAIGIDQVGDADVRHLAVCPDVAATAAVEAGHSDVHCLVGSENLARGFRAADGEERAGERPFLQEGSSGLG